MLRNLKGLDDSDDDTSSKGVTAKKQSGQTNKDTSKYTTQEFEDST